MTDSELQMMILRGMYEHRDREGGRCYYQDFRDIVSPAVFSRICAQLHQKGLIRWKSADPEGDSLGVGFGSITAAGVDLIENSSQQKQQTVGNARTKMTSAHCPKCGDQREAFALFTDKNEEAVMYDPDAPPAVFYEKSTS